MSTVPANLPHRLERTLLIHARPSTVFRFFTDSARWASWWGTGSSIDPTPGGQLRIRYPNGIEARGEVLDIQPPSRLTFTYGYVSGTPIAQGASLVTIVLTSEGDHTRLTLTHAFDDAAVRDEHVQGWRYQLSLFANVVCDETYARAEASLDAWFEAWSTADEHARARALAPVAAPTVHFRDQFGTAGTVEEINGHIGGVHRFMPGLTLQREGKMRRCQEVALVDWIARASNGDVRGRGSNVFTFNVDGQIASVTGFWHQNP